MVLLLKLDSAQSWPCSTEKECRRWFHACQPPCMYFRIVWRRLKWRDDHIAHPARAKPTWERSFEVMRGLFSACMQKHIGLETGRADFDAVVNCIPPCTTQMKLMAHPTPAQQKRTKRPAPPMVQPRRSKCLFKPDANQNASVGRG